MRSQLQLPPGNPVRFRRQLAQAFADKVEEWSRLVAEIDHDPDRYERLLDERVFSNLD